METFSPGHTSSVEGLDRMLGMLSLNGATPASLASRSPFQLLLDTESGPVSLFLIEGTDESGWLGVVYARCWGVDFTDWLESWDGSGCFPKPQDAIKRWALSRWDPAKVRRPNHPERYDYLPDFTKLPDDSVSWFVCCAARSSAVDPKNADDAPFAHLTRVTGATLNTWSEEHDAFVPYDMPPEVLQ